MAASWDRLSKPLLGILGFAAVESGSIFGYMMTPPIFGPARVIEGDTIHIGIQKVRIWGIAAPEMHEIGGLASKTHR